MPGHAQETAAIGRTQTGEPAHRPSLKDTARLFEGPLGIRSISLTGLFVLACFYTLYLARDFFLLVMLAIIFMFSLTPPIRTLKRIGVREGLGSALVIVAVAAFIGLLASNFQAPSQNGSKRRLKVEQNKAKSSAAPKVPS